MAGIFAFKDAMKKANPILLEPIMGVEVTTPEEYQGDLMGDINRRRGQIQGMENKAGACIIAAHVPLELLFGYVTDIRSLSKGRRLRFDHPLAFCAGAERFTSQNCRDLLEGSGPYLNLVLLSP